MVYLLPKLRSEFTLCGKFNQSNIISQIIRVEIKKFGLNLKNKNKNHLNNN